MKTKIPRKPPQPTHPSTLIGSKPTSALRIWHNLKTQIGTEGERANASGDVLNPAILNIGTPEDNNR